MVQHVQCTPVAVSIDYSISRIVKVILVHVIKLHKCLSFMAFMLLVFWWDWAQMLCKRNDETLTRCVKHCGTSLKIDNE